MAGILKRITPYKRIRPERLGQLKMAINYSEQLVEEIMHIPQEHLPALFNIVHSFRESVGLQDNALDKAKCLKAIDAALATPEPEQAFDRHAWLANAKEQLKSKATSDQ